MFAHTVTPYAHGTVGCHVVPEVMGCRVVPCGGVVLLPYPFEADELGYLCVGMLTVEEGARVGRFSPLHSIDFVGVAVSLGCLQVLRIAQ